MKRFLLAFAMALTAGGCVLGEDDEPANPCDECGPGTVCVQLLGGSCGSMSVTCEPAVPGCDEPVCSAECNAAFCDPGGISTCSGPPCPEDLAGAIHCYGV
jgi:hypothetical protein